MEARGYYCSAVDLLLIKPLFSHQKQLSMTLEQSYGTFCIIGGHLGFLTLIA